MNKITFIDAYNGGIKLFAGVGNVKGYAKNPWALAYIIKTCGLADRLFHSSSMDFSSEDGFETDQDAWQLWDEALQLLEEDKLNGTT